MSEALCLSEIEQKLSTEYVGRKIFYAETTSSTNDDAKASVSGTETKAFEGNVFVAENQTNGRGRMFRSWITEPFTSIAMSILIKPDMKPEDAPTITPVLAISAVEAIKKATGLEVQIKWPNDLFINGKKLAGILTEMRVDADAEVGKVKFIVAGIGVNVNQSEMNEELATIATSLKMESGMEFSREAIVVEILNSFEINYKYFLRHGLGYFSGKLKEYSFIMGKEVVVISGLEMIEGTAEDIDETGNLILRLEDGRVKRIIYGDVGLKFKEVLK
jgi:BirA family transcriptional regulator, biotin operon repressor / biotin---[acetyl-CoA-carboxylase] ligase